MREYHMFGLLSISLICSMFSTCFALRERGGISMAQFHFFVRVCAAYLTIIRRQRTLRRESGPVGQSLARVCR
jgi:hypothetical protein